LSNAEIAERLGISEKTVRNRPSHLFDKLGGWSRAQAIVFGRERGFVAREAVVSYVVSGFSRTDAKSA
jgi:DNA-binding NarL/FixJ family response regulator